LAGSTICGFLACQNYTTQKGAVAKAVATETKPFFKLSLAQWSFHRALQENNMDHLQFAAKAKSLGFHGIEYVNQFLKDKVEDASYLEQMNKEADQNKIKQLLIMVDGEGGLANLDKAERAEAVTNHIKWINAAKIIGCHSIRVNCFGEGESSAVSEAGIDGLRRLSEIAALYYLAML